MFEAVPHLARLDSVPENAWTPLDAGDMSGAGDFRSAVTEHYLANPIMRASAVMAELTRLASERVRLLAAE
jgi:NADH-quinone oxidoreductase subunit G